jgi:magnesium transporter
MARKRRKRYHPPGTLPGTLAAHAEAGDAPVRITSFRYDANLCEEQAIALSEIPSLAPPEGEVLWLDVCDLSDPSVVQAIGDRFRIHSLALEDVLDVPQRPKVEWYGDLLLVVPSEIRYPELPEQMALLLADRVVVSFQERVPVQHAGAGLGVRLPRAAASDGGRRGRDALLLPAEALDLIRRRPTASSVAYSASKPR